MRRPQQQKYKRYREIMSIKTVCQRDSRWNLENQANYTRNKRIIWYPRGQLVRFDKRGDSKSMDAFDW
jgi:hypothetical protein